MNMLNILTMVFTHISRILLFVGLAAMLYSCSSHRSAARSSIPDGFTVTPSGLQYKIIQQGTGPEALPGREVFIRETTSYLDGTVLYSNENTGNPVKVLIGGNQATAAVDEGLRGMREGEIRQLIAPSSLVKRKFYPPNVSPDSALAIKIILYKIL